MKLLLILIVLALYTPYARAHDDHEHHHHDWHHDWHHGHRHWYNGHWYDDDGNIIIVPL